MKIKIINVKVEYFKWQWKKRKIVLNKKKLIKKKMICSAIYVIGDGSRLSFEQDWGSTNLDCKQIKKLVIENYI